MREMVIFAMKGKKVACAMSLWAAPEISAG